MKLPQRPDYLWLCLYITATFTALYLIKLALDACAYTLTNPHSIIMGLKGLVRAVFSATAPIVTALVIYYILSPLRDRLQGLLKSRALSALCCILLIVLPLLGLGLYLVYIIRGIINGDTGLFKAVEKVYLSLKALGDKYSPLAPLIDKYIKSPRLYAPVIRGDIVKRAADILVCLGLGLIMSLYLLTESKPFKGFGSLCRLILPKRLYLSLRLFFEDMDAIFQGYIRGQLTDGLIMALLISLGLWLCKIPFALLIGIISGFSNLIPYFGALTGMCLGVAFGLLSGRPVRALYALGVIIALQQLDSLYIVPRVVGKPVKISPFLVIASLSLGGRIAGLWGLVLAVPITAVIRLLFLRIYKRQAGDMSDKFKP